MKHFSFIFFLLLLPGTAGLLAQCGETIEGNSGNDTLEFQVIPGLYLLSVYTEHVPDCVELAIGNQPTQKMCFGDDCTGTQGNGISLDSCVAGPVLWDNGFGPIPQSWLSIVNLGYLSPVTIVDTGGVALIKFTIPVGICLTTVTMVSNPGNTIWAYRLVCPEGLPTPPDTVLVENTSCNPDSVEVTVVHATTENGCPVDTVTTTDYAPLETEVQTTTCYPDSVGSQVNTFITESGCDSIVTTVVTFIDTCNTVTPNTGCVYVPNAFSPNDDGINDVFIVFTGASCIKEIKSFHVFSRWGEEVFKNFNFPANDFAYGWDGTFRGKPMDTAVFAWFAEVEFGDGRVELFKGDVTLLR